jgi:osmoprotectant transport system permease protein
VIAFLGELAAWFTDPAHWTGNDSIPLRVGEHIGLSVAGFALAVLVAIPLGLLIGHTGRGSAVVVGASTVGRAIPSVAILGLAFPVTLTLGWGLGVPPTLLALMILAIPPILTNLYVGLRDVDPDLRDAAAGSGMTGRQVLARVEWPLALPLALTGMRTAAVTVVATATIGAILSTGGLGRYIIDGIAQQDYPKMVAGALLVMLLAFAVEALFAVLQRRAVSAGIRSHPSPGGVLASPEGRAGGG